MMDQNGILNKEFSTKRLTLDLADKNTEYFFIEHNLKAVGFIKIKNYSITSLPFANSAEVEKIYVLPDFKGMGIGKLVKVPQHGVIKIYSYV